MNIMMIVAWIGEKIFGDGGSIARGLISAAVGLGSTAANMMYFQDWMTKGILTKFMDMSDESVWGTITVVNGSVAGSGFWTTALNVYKAVAVVGFGLFLAYWLINLIEKSNQDRLNGNEFVRLGLQLVVGITLITYGPVLMHGVSMFSGWSINVVLEGMENTNGEVGELPQHSTGNLYLDTTLKWMGFGQGDWPITEGYCGGSTTSSNKSKCDLCYIKADGYERESPRYGYTKNTYLVGAGGYESSDALLAAWKKYGIGEAIAKILIGLLTIVIQAVFTLINLVLIIIIASTALSRSIQIIIYVMFAPLAFADTFHQGFISSKSWRYIQKFLALCIQAGIIYASVILAPKIASTLGLSIVGTQVNVQSSVIPEQGIAGEIIVLPMEKPIDFATNVVEGTIETVGTLLGMVITSVFTFIGYLTALGLSQKAAQISNDVVGV